MLLTSLQHRKIAKVLQSKAALLAAPDRARTMEMERSARLHVNPSIAPAAKNPLNQIAPRVQPSKPKLVSSP
jgi:hypothetical protein